MRLSWPLTGRNEQLRAIGSAIANPGVPGVVVSGPAGVGKSRVARESLTVAAAHRHEIRWTAGASSARAIPLGAFNAWTSATVTEPVHLVRSVIEALTAAPPGTRVVVGVDDAHLLDELSLFVVHQIVARAAATVVLTVREDEPVPPALREIWSGYPLHWIDLPPLSPDQTGDLLAATLGAPVEPESATRLCELTRGNALYLRTIVEREVADGRLAQEHDHWRWSGNPVMPPDLVGAIESRIGALPEPVADVIDTVAVAEPVDLALLVRIAGSAAVEEADARGLITVEPESAHVRLAHPLYGEVRRRRAPRSRLRRLRGVVSTELAASGGAGDIRCAVQRATLSMESDLAPDADLLATAARGAVWLADLSLAERLAAAAIRAGAGLESTIVRAHALSWLGRGDEANRTLDDVADGQLSDTERARLAFAKASNALWALGDIERAQRIVDGVVGVDSAEGLRFLQAFRIVHWFATDQPLRALQAAEGLRPDELPAVVGAEIGWVLTAMSADAGRTTEAVTYAEQGAVAAERGHDAPHMSFNIADAHLSALLLSGRVNEAAELARQARDRAADLPGDAQLLATAVAGRAALGSGALAEAARLLGQAAAGLTARGHGMGWGYRYRVGRATALALRGETEAAAAEMSALDRARRPFRSLDYERSLARAWTAASAGAVTEAISAALGAADRSAAQGQFAAEVLCRQTATQFGDRSSASRLTELMALVEGPRAGLAARFATALATDDAAELSTLSADFEAVGDRVAAIDAAAHAALIYRRQNLQGSALRYSARAEGLAEQGGGIVTPTLGRARLRLPLTDRETEVVMLIGAGLSNRAVADRLTLSVRTVESHIYRAMGKTGTASREELAALLKDVKKCHPGG